MDNKSAIHVHELSCVLTQLMTEIQQKEQIEMGGIAALFECNGITVCAGRPFKKVSEFTAGPSVASMIDLA